VCRTAPFHRSNRIDFSDIPEASHQAKQLIAIRIAPRLPAELRQMAARQHKPYQTLVHDLFWKIR
jgi:hypothetical protein